MTDTPSQPRDAGEVEKLATSLADSSPRQILAKAFELYGDQLAVAFSGAEDVILLEYARQLNISIRVFSLDTGRLHAETYRFFAEVESHYKLRIEYCVPQHAALENLVRKKGLFSFYEDGHEECCAIRKVEPMRRHLANFAAWANGRRQDQSPRTRASLAAVELDSEFGGQDGKPLLKWNPLYRMKRDDLWDEIRAFEVPFNPLHRQGIVSLGCEPCTRAILPGEPERAGRWWWEAEDKKECGIHK